MEASKKYRNKYLNGFRKLTSLKYYAYISAALWVSPSFAQHSVTTHAGSSQGFMDATGTAAKFKAPTGICISSDGAFLFVADYSGNRIRKINITTKAVTTLAGNGNSGYADGAGTSAQFSYPSGICISPAGDFLYVCDNGNSRIRKIEIANANVTTIAGDGNYSYADNATGTMASFNGPTDVKIAGDSVLYVSDTENHLIRKVNISTTTVSTVAGMLNVGGFQNGIGTNAAFRLPKGLAVSNDGTKLYVADNGNNMIRMIELASADVTSVSGEGTAGFADNSNGALVKFNAPNGVAVVPGDDNLLYVADNSNHRLRQVNINTGATTTIAGNGAVPPASTFADNANGSNAKFFYPTNLIVSPDNKDIYVADQGNFRVRRVKTDLTFTGIEELERGMQLFPNPCNAYVKLSGLNSKASVYLSDISGKLISEFDCDYSDFIINTNEYADGIYFLKINYTDKSNTYKLIIQK